jgi:hypothetical protein
MGASTAAASTGAPNHAAVQRINNKAFHRQLLDFIHASFRGDGAIPGVEVGLSFFWYNFLINDCQSFFLVISVQTAVKEQLIAQDTVKTFLRSIQYNLIF